MSWYLDGDTIEALLEQFGFDDILEMNDLTEYEVLNLLYRNGYLQEPRNFLKENDYGTSLGPDYV